MKLRRIVSMMLAVALLIAMSAFAGAETAVVNTWTVENGYVTMNERTGALAIQSRETGLYTLTAPDGTALTTAPYVYMDTSDTMFEVAVESGLNVFGMIDSNGKLMMPMQYGDTIYISDRWQLGVTLTDATSDNYDYKTFDGKSFYLISGYDVYYQGAKVGTLDRLAYRNAYARGAYLYVIDQEQNYTYYDSTLTASSYKPSYDSSSEYDETKDGVFHRGSGQQVGVPGCTLTSDDVELDILLIEGRFVDLQGNVIFAADAKYEHIYNFEGDYARVRMNDKYGLIDRTGREVLACEYDEINSNVGYFDGGYQIAVKDGKVGYLNTNGEVTCEFKYSENNVKSTYKMPFTHLMDLDGSIIVLSGAVGELEARFMEVDLSNYGSPLFTGEPAEKKAGVYDLYGNEIIAADGMYDDCYDFQISDDGSVISGYNTERVYVIYQLGGAEAEVETEAAAEAEVTETAGQPAVGGALLEQSNELKCAKCGFKPEAGTTPKFCAECGNAF